MTHDEYHPYTSAELEAMPTLTTGQADDLKVETADTRWWLSRLSIEDGETHRVYLERNIEGRWTVTGEYEPYGA